MRFLKNLFGRREPVVSVDRPLRSPYEWQQVMLLIPYDEGADPDDEYQPWLEFGAELGDLVSDEGRGDLVATDDNGADQFITFECEDATALATFLKKRIMEEAEEDLPPGSQLILTRTSHEHP